MGGCLKWALYSYKRPISPFMAQTVMISLPCKFGKTKLSMVVTFPPLPVLFFKSKQKISTRAKTNKKCKSCCIFIKKYYEEKRGLSEIQAEVRDDGKKRSGNVQLTNMKQRRFASRAEYCNTCRMPRATFHVLRDTYFLPRSMGHVSCDTNHVPRAAVYMSRAMCTCFYSLGESVEGAVLDVGHLVVVEGEAGQLAQAPECPLPKQFLLEAVQLPKQIL